MQEHERNDDWDEAVVDGNDELDEEMILIDNSEERALFTLLKRPLKQRLQNPLQHGSFHSI